MKKLGSTLIENLMTEEELLHDALSENYMERAVIQEQIVIFENLPELIKNGDVLKYGEEFKTPEDMTKAYKRIMYLKNCLQSKLLSKEDQEKYMWTIKEDEKMRVDAVMNMDLTEKEALKVSHGAYLAYENLCEDKSDRYLYE